MRRKQASLRLTERSFPSLVPSELMGKSILFFGSRQGGLGTARRSMLSDSPSEVGCRSGRKSSLQEERSNARWSTPTRRCDTGP